MSIAIYTSEKVLPYVYFGLNPITNEYYFGSRTSEQIKLPSHLDLLQYRTSSKYVKPRFDEFVWIILAEFFNWEDAYDFEQELIFEHLGKVGCLNKKGHKRSGEVRWIRTGTPVSESAKIKMSKAKTGTILSEEHKLKISNTMKNQPKTDETKINMSNASKGKKKKPFSESHKINMGNAKRGRRHSEQSKINMSNAAKGKKKIPQSEERKDKVSLLSRDQRAILLTLKELGSSYKAIQLYFETNFGIIMARTTVSTIYQKAKREQVNNIG